MFLRDVNNYGSVYEDSTKENEHIKLKGDYEIYKEFHKDPSMRIVTKAVKDYFVYGVPVEQTIKNCRDIYDFCMCMITNSKSIPYFRHFDESGKIVDDKLDRTTRYYISTKGKHSGTLIKSFEDGKITGVNVGYSVVIFNKYEEKNWDDYKIDYQFYIAEANKLINPLIYKELDLFG